MAIACLRLSFLPLRPLFKLPRFFLCIARLTSFEADLEYLRAVVELLRVSTKMPVAKNRC
jgi:hypothetical protein